MQGKIFGVPFVLIVLVGAILVPVLLGQAALSKKIDGVMKVATVKEACALQIVPTVPAATPTKAVETPTPSKKLLAPVVTPATIAGETK